MNSVMNMLDNIVVKDHHLGHIKERNLLLYLNKGYDFKEVEYGAIKKGYIPHIGHMGRRTGNKD
jgi:hypothetical protein